MHGILTADMERGSIRAQPKTIGVRLLKVTICSSLDVEGNAVK